MTTTKSLTCLGALLLVAAFPWRQANACGGCFAPVDTVTTVDSHRMVIALGTQRTVLWDQIRYTGEPDDFVWVLPVPTPEVTIELADPLFFDQLEVLTAPRVQAPPLPPGPSCPPPPDDWWGGGVGTDAGFLQDANPVDVYREEVVGPYQTVVIGSTDPQALIDWLNANNYDVPNSTLPVLAHYINQQSKFVVLRLAPDVGVSAMQPIRIGYPGYMNNFPLKMVTVGAAGQLDLTLWVAAEQRYQARNYGTVVINEGDLVYDFASRSSNYRALFAAAIDDAGGRAWVAEYAQPLDNLFLGTPDETDVIESVVANATVTRLRTSTLLDHLTDDLELAPSPDAGRITNLLFAQNGINFPPPPTCPDYNNDGRPDSWADYYGRRGGGCRISQRSTTSSLALGLGLALGALVVVRRRRRPALCAKRKK